LTQHWRLAFENKFVGAWNFWDAKNGQYRSGTFTIREIRDERVVMQGGRKELKRLVFFEGKQIPMIMTRTMGKVIEQMYGPIPKDWIGKSITLYVQRGVRVQDGVGDVLRIRNERGGDGLKRQLRGEPEPPPEEAMAPEEFGDMAGSDDPDKGP
jgi:hypothetical protein